MTRSWPVTLLSGTLFGAGLALGGMVDPARVRGFLDIFGDWDPTLAFVMGGAVIVMAIAWRIQARMAQPLIGATFALPDRTDLTPRLIGGAALFGVGWALGGYCPGPGLVSSATGSLPALVFVGTMLLGMRTQHAVDDVRAGEGFGALRFKRARTASAADTASRG